VEDYAYYIGNSFAGLVYLVVGIRLYAMSARNAQTPDRLLSVTFVLWALSYFLYDIPSLLVYGEALLPPLFSFGSAFALYLADITFAVFTRAVFRNQERWALWLVAGMVGCVIVGVAGSVWVGDWGVEYPLSHPWWWVTHVGSAAPSVWMATEGFTQYSKARRRRQLGLCAPQVCNRYLLWGLAGSLWLFLEVVDGAQYIAYQSTGQWSESLTVLVACFEIAPAGIIWLVFFPPTFYRNWIDNRATVADSAEGGSSHGG
jgi:hypothetical protein